MSSDFVRHTTVIHLRGAGEEGVGEDVTYEAEEQARFQGRGRPSIWPAPTRLPPSRSASRGCPTTAAGASRAPPSTSRCGREGLSLHEALGRTPQPVTFVVSTALGSDGAGRLRGLLEQHPGLRFKLDPTSDWDEALVAELAELNCVDVVDFKEAYTWREPERTAGPEVYRLVVEALPTALIEDPGVADPEKRPCSSPIAAGSRGML